MDKTRREIENYKAKESLKGKRGQSFYSGVLVLSLSAVIVKIIGLIFKIPMLRLLGSEGMGYFNSAYEIYALLCVISTSGLPVAMSVMISRKKDGEHAERVFGSAMRLFLILGAVGSAVMLAFSYSLARFLGNDKSFYAIIAIAPTLFFICVTSAYRGYFQGKGEMTPTALSQVIEAISKLILGLLFSCLALNAGLGGEIAAACAVLGLLFGCVLSSFYLLLVKKFRSEGEGRSLICNDRPITAELIKMSLPITVSAAVVSITKMIDMTMILRRLQSIGYPGEQAFSVYGSYTTLCLPLFSLAPALIGSVAMPTLPRLSRAIAIGDRKAQTETVNDSIALTSIVSMPISAGLALYSGEILELIFSGESEAISLCTPLLTLLAFSVSLSSLVTVTNAVLQAYGHPSLPLISMGVGAVIKIILAYFLIGNEAVNIAGAPISTFFCDIAINLVSFSFICRYIPGKIRVERVFVRPFLASVISVAASKIIYGNLSAKFGEGSLNTILCIAIAGLLYLITCLALRVIDIKEIKGLSGSRCVDG
ncbi:MAG: polysaccharide biosynthesis protein [Clostridia bacterium]|nr:polysaccharide biosynthesis protein [Clostridia bacterium]